MIEFQWEKWSDIVLDAMPLFIRYFNEEGALFIEELPLDPDFNLVSQLELLGRLRVFTVRRDGVLLGANIFNCGSLLFRKSTVGAEGLILYLVPEERQSKEKIGKELIVGAEKQLKEWGVQLVIYTAGSKVDIGPMLEHWGYTRIGGKYEKLL
jgi:hypothetical protein